uniref:PDZ domain-containing protein n=1 Tax=Heterorhabditis bacteriophora TaxID=37862 RepID=A0A1I7WQG0_HETBA
MIELLFKVASNNASRAGRPVVIGVGASKPTITKSTKQLINGGRAKIDAANGLSKLQQGRYKAAADKILKVIGDTTCRKFLEAEPKLVDLLQSFTKSQFGKSLDVMQELKDRFHLDPYLSAHVEPLYKLIRDRAIVQYLTPFASADLRTMAEVFRTDVSGVKSWKCVTILLNEWNQLYYVPLCNRFGHYLLLIVHLPFLSLGIPIATILFPYTIYIFFSLQLEFCSIVDTNNRVPNIIPVTLFYSLVFKNNLNNIFSPEFILPIKSQFGAEFRRFSISLGGGRPSPSFNEFYETVQNIHRLTEEQRAGTHITYVSQDGSNLPISNDDNLRKALENLPKILRIVVQNKGESLEEEFGYGVSNDTVLQRRRKVSISAPQDFRRVSSILDADILPHELRRVRLCKFYNNKPLGFFIRDDNIIFLSYSERLTPWGPIATPGIFISRLLPNGLAASTNLLSINDEILEVNGIDVSEKSLDQVTDIMIANSTNLILTVKPAVPSSFPYLTYAPPPYTIPPPPGYCSPQQQRMSQSCYSFHSNLHYYGRENHAEIARRNNPDIFVMTYNLTGGFGEFDVNDRQRSGMPRTAKTDGLKSLLDEKPSQTRKGLVEELGVDKATVFRRLHEMGKIRKLGKWVPYELSENCIGRRFNSCI